MEIDLFGIKLGDSSNEYTKKTEEYEIPKRILLQKLGITESKVRFIQYDYQKGILTIKKEV